MLISTKIATQFLHIKVRESEENQTTVIITILSLKCLKLSEDITKI